MPDEIGTETTLPDALSVAESLFGDGPDHEAAAVAGEEDFNEETEQDLQSPDGVEEQTGAPEELKVVLSIKGDRATIGVQRPSADPHIESFDDPDLSGLAQEVPAVVERAKARWETNPGIPLSSVLLPRPGASAAVSGRRSSPQRTRKERTSSSPKR